MYVIVVLNKQLADIFEIMVYALYTYTQQFCSGSQYTLSEYTRVIVNEHSSKNKFCRQQQFGWSKKRLVATFGSLEEIVKFDTV